MAYATAEWYNGNTAVRAQFLDGNLVKLPELPDRDTQMAVTTAQGSNGVGQRNRDTSAASACDRYVSVQLGHSA